MPSSGVQTCARSEEHTSELQSHDNLVCRLLLEKKHEIKAAPTLIIAERRRMAGREVHSHRSVLHSLRSTKLLQHTRFVMCQLLRFFFFNDTATPEIYTLSLHDALPI